LRKKPAPGKRINKTQKKIKIMIKVNVYGSKGLKKTSINLPDNIVGKFNEATLAQAMFVYSDNTHKKTARAKTRAEVWATGAKVWRQKGTGRARHGSRRAPIFVGGGKAHGPKGIKRVLDLTKKIKSLGLLSAINAKAKENRIVVVEDIASIKKTKDASKALEKVIESQSTKEIKSILLVLSSENKNSKLVFRNIKGLSVQYFPNLNAYIVFRNSLVIFDKEVFLKNKKSNKGDEKKIEKTLKSKNKYSKKISIKKAKAKKTKK